VSVETHAELAARVEASFAAEDWDVDSACVEDAIGLLDRGEVRVAEPTDGGWVVNEWAKKAVLLYFRVRGMETIESGPFEYHDKLPLKHGFVEAGVRVVPPAAVRYGAFLSPGVILMPSYVNIGAWVGPGTMVDTWATVGSCAQIGANVHLSGGVGIGGVLEPVQAAPVVAAEAGTAAVVHVDHGEPATGPELHLQVEHGGGLTRRAPVAHHDQRRALSGRTGEARVRRLVHVGERRDPAVGRELDL